MPLKTNLLSPSQPPAKNKTNKNSYVHMLGLYVNLHLVDKA